MSDHVDIYWSCNKCDRTWVWEDHRAAMEHSGTPGHIVFGAVHPTKGGDKNEGDRGA